MRREYHRWFAQPLGRDMELLTFGHAGRPVIVFPTSMGSFFEYEDRGMIGALHDKLEGGLLQLFCVSTVDTESFYGSMLDPRDRIARYLQYEQYLVDEVVPFVRQHNGSDTMGLTGCSFGAYHAMTMALRHPDVFTSCITMGGAFDIMRFLHGYFDEDAYLLSPPHFLPNLTDPWFLDRFRLNKWVLVTGERDICRADTEHMARLLAHKDIPHSLHVWGNGSLHDWPEWLKMASAYVP
ncbi:MAG: esterase family protein [Vicinamibacterales bacterium]|jgi:esterase/lipase superfamily enzyme